MQYSLPNSKCTVIREAKHCVVQRSHVSDIDLEHVLKNSQSLHVSRLSVMCTKADQSMCLCNARQQYLLLGPVVVRLSL